MDRLSGMNGFFYRVRVGLVFGVMVGALAVRGGAEGPETGARIPEVHATSFAGEAVNLPEGLRGKVGVLVLGFSHASRDEVAGWGKRLAGDYRESPTVIYYEMPMLAGVPRMMRGFIAGQIKGSVPDRAKARFVPLLENEAGWREVTHSKSGDDAYVLVVDEHGLVQLEMQGAATDAAYGAVKQRVEALRAGIGRAVR